MKKLIFCLAAISVVAVSAMPTKKEVTAAREVVAELMSDVVADQKAGKLTAAQVAEKALELAVRAETEAAKLLLIQGAVMGFARGGEPARAAEAMQRMKREIKDITPEYEADVLSRAVKTVPAKSGRLLYAMLDDTKRLVRYRRDLPVLETKLAKMDTPEIREEFVKMEGFGERSFEKLLAAARKAQTVSMPKFLYSLGIPGKGKDLHNELYKDRKERAADTFSHG